MDRKQHNFVIGGGDRAFWMTVVGNDEQGWRGHLNVVPLLERVEVMDSDYVSAPFPTLEACCGHLCLEAMKWAEADARRRNVS